MTKGPYKRLLYVIPVLTIMIVWLVPLKVAHLIYEHISTSDIFDHMATSQHSNVTSSRSIESLESTDKDVVENENICWYSWTTPCKFRPNAPKPVILFALGRSGSSVTWNTLSALTGKRNIAPEITGGNPKSSLEYFNCFQNNTVFQQFSNWTIQKLCHLQREGFRKDMNEKTGISGFQWKPFASSWQHPFAIKGLEAVANSKDPEVKSIYLLRNPLDRKVSNLKHRNAKLNSDQTDVITAHCEVGDANCQDRHSQFSRNIIFPTGEELMKWIKNAERQDQRVRERLDKLNIPFVEVSYEKLYGVGKITDEESAEEWMKVFRYLEVGPQKGLTMEKVRGAFSLAPTHKSNSRNETIENFDAVAETLKGTKFEHYLTD